MDGVIFSQAALRAMAVNRPTALRQPSTDDLDLATLPDRLDDAMLARVQDIASSPCPPMIPGNEKHLSKCLRIMLAVLPRQASDELSGELFVAAYQRKLGHLPDSAVSFIADKAMERCRWFPTIAECLDIASEWRRDDEALKRWVRAGQIANRENNLRADERRAAEFEWSDKGSAFMRQSDVDNLSPALVSIGLRCGALVQDDDGKVRPYRPQPEMGPDEDGLKW